MIFRSSRRKLTVSHNLQLYGQNISLVEHTKFLGVILDSKLTWYLHIKQIHSKISKGIGIICRAKRLLNKPSLLTLYNSFIYPYLTYCIEVWGAAADTYLDKILKLQKKIVRIINFSPFRAHSEPIFRNLGIRKINLIYEYNVGVFMYKFTHNMLPTIFSPMFIYNNTIHAYSTRQSQLLHVPIAKFTNTTRTIRYKGVNIWNKISQEFPTNVTLPMFKSSLSSYCKRV